MSKKTKPKWAKNADVIMKRLGNNDEVYALVDISENIWLSWDREQGLGLEGGDHLDEEELIILRDVLNYMFPKEK